MAEEKKASIFDKLTDPNLYTGAHKNRFDENGKGKGIDGRVDRVEADGYVDGFKKTDKVKKTVSKVRKRVLSVVLVCSSYNLHAGASDVAVGRKLSFFR